jgi:hypothetical protein
MRISASKAAKALQKHPLAYSVLGLLVAGYAFFVIYIIATNGLGELGNALRNSVGVVLFFVCFSIFPFWASEHSFVWVFVVELLLILVWGFVCDRRRYPLRVLALGLLVFAATNLTLNFVFWNWAD